MKIRYITVKFTYLYFDQSKKQKIEQNKKKEKRNCFYSDQQNPVEVQADSASVHQVMEDAAGIKQGLRQSVRAVN